MAPEKLPSSRRVMLKKSMVALASLAMMPVMVAGKSAMAGTAAKQDFHYQDHPRDGKKCSDCSAFIAETGTCRIIEGAISSNGWCMAFSAK